MLTGLFFEGLVAGLTDDFSVKYVREKDKFAPQTSPFPTFVRPFLVLTDMPRPGGSYGFSLCWLILSVPSSLSFPPASIFSRLSFNHQCNGLLSMRPRSLRLMRRSTALPPSNILAPVPLSSMSTSSFLLRWIHSDTGSNARTQNATGTVHRH